MTRRSLFLPSASNKQTFADKWGRAVIELKARSAEAAEAELTRFVERRHDQRAKTEGERREEELWVQTVKRYHEREQRGLLWERLRYHESMIRAASKNAEVVMERHRAEAERCEQLLGISETKGAA
jgi:hypothetical protein